MGDRPLGLGADGVGGGGERGWEIGGGRRRHRQCVKGRVTAGASNEPSVGLPQPARSSPLYDPVCDVIDQITGVRAGPGEMRGEVAGGHGGSVQLDEPRSDQLSRIAVAPTRHSAAPANPASKSSRFISGAPWTREGRAGARGRARAGPGSPTLLSSISRPACCADVEHALGLSAHRRILSPPPGIGMAILDHVAPSIPAPRGPADQPSIVRSPPA